MPASRIESWTVLGPDGVPVGPVERYLTYLTDTERSPNTVKAYAHDLKDYLTFLACRGLDWREVRLEDIGEYVAWLRLPPAGRDGRVAVLPSAGAHVTASTINRKLSALSAFYQHQARHGVDVGDLLVTWQPPGHRGGWKPFLHHISKGRPQPRRAIALKAPGKLPRVLTVAEAQAILDACDRLRDRFLLAVLWDAGLRAGEALGLRHEDIAAAERSVTVVPRINDNRARSKSRQQRTVPVSAQVIRLYADYLHREYGNLDSDSPLCRYRHNGETRRRVKVIGRLPGETSCLTLVWAVLDRASRGWRGLTMTADGLRLLQDLRRSLLEPPAQLRPRTVTAAQPGDHPETVRATA
jgi:integrase/recombinase XerD